MACRPNDGWVTPDEKVVVRRSPISISRMGGVGGVHQTILARLAAAHFTIADFDLFPLARINRWVGAFMSSVGYRKTPRTRVAQ